MGTPGHSRGLLKIPKDFWWFLGSIHLWRPHEITKDMTPSTCVRNLVKFRWPTSLKMRMQTSQFWGSTPPPPSPWKSSSINLSLMIIGPEGMRMKMKFAEIIIYSHQTINKRLIMPESLGFLGVSTSLFKNCRRLVNCRTPRSAKHTTKIYIFYSLLTFWLFQWLFCDFRTCNATFFMTF